MYRFGFPCSHQGFASAGQPRGSRQDVFTTINFAACIGVFAYFSAVPPLDDNHHHVEGVSAIIMIVLVVPDGSTKSTMPLEYIKGIWSMCQLHSWVVLDRAES